MTEVRRTRPAAGAGTRLAAGLLGRAVLWLPVCLGLGIWVYFEMGIEPPLWWAALAPLPLVLALPVPRRWSILLVLLLWPGMVGAGFSLAVAHAHLIAAPMLSVPLDETVEGRVREVSRSASGAPRVLLDRLQIFALDASETPARVRIALLDLTPETAPIPGTRLRVYARLLPPGEPAEPGAYDFRRRAYFEQLGAVGYSATAVLILGPDPGAGIVDRARAWLWAFRGRLSAGLRAALPGPEGAFAAAIVTGDRSAIPEDDAEALRAANLAHLLAISGLHMGILTGLVFAAMRLGLALVPWLLYRVPAKKIAALTALVAGLAYLGVSGASVATQRAFVMVAVALLAMTVDRPAITLRGLAIAAAIVLTIRPVALMDPGFQLSFAATTALVAVFDAFRRQNREPRARGPGRRALAWAGGVALASTIAGAATAPYAAAHFGRLAPWGLAANLAAVPVMGVVIAPAAVLAGLLLPIGLEGWALVAMGEGIAWVLRVAHEVASWPGSFHPVTAAPAMTVPLLTLGALWMVLIPGLARWLGAVAMAAALGLWQMGIERPDVLIGPGARLIGVIGPEGRVVDHPRAQGFTAETWLRRDADPVDQETAAARPGLTRGRGRVSADLPRGWRLEVFHGRRPDRAALASLCTRRTILVLRHAAGPEGPCLLLDRQRLAETGAVAIRISEEGPIVTPARQGRRPWTPAP